MVGTMYSITFDWSLNITNYKLSNADFRREKERVGSREKLSLMKTKFIMTNSCLPATYTNRCPLKLNLFDLSGQGLSWSTKPMAESKNDLY